MFPRQNEHLHWSKVYCGVKCMCTLLMHLKIVDLVVGSTVSTSRQVFRGLRRSRGSTVMTGFTLSRHLLGTWETITLYCRLEEVLWNTWEKYFERLWGNTMNKYFERSTLSVPTGGHLGNDNALLLGGTWKESLREKKLEDANWFENIAKGTTDPRVEFILPKLNYLRIYHKFKHKSWSHYWYDINIKYNKLITLLIWYKYQIQ